jgi:hypothetical protein
MFYDIDGNTAIRLSDGVTPGGIPFGIISTRVSYSPQFATANNETLNGTVTTGSYVKQGHICHFRVNVDFANTTNFGNTSQYQITLPFPAAATMTIRGGTLHQTATDAIYHIAGILHVDDSNTLMKLYYSGSTTDLAWKNSTPVLATSNTSHFDISGAYEVASSVSIL